MATDKVDSLFNNKYGNNDSRSCRTRMINVRTFRLAFAGAGRPRREECRVVAS